MTPHQTIFISAVSSEFKGARQLVANTLLFLGYKPVWQDIFGTEQGDLRKVLRRQIDTCKGVVQLVGFRYGFEPPVADEQFGRVSYTQYEALYARQRGKKVWRLLVDESFPLEKQEPEPEELRQLQEAYRRKLQADTHLFHPLNSLEALETDVLKLRDDLARLRRGHKQWAVGVLTLLVLVAALSMYLVRQQQRTSGEVAKLTQAVAQFQAVEAHQELKGQDKAAVEQETYAQLAKKLGVDEKVLREKLPSFAKELQRSPDATPLARANAAYVAGDHPEAQRLALQAAAEAQKANPPRLSEAINAFKLAGWASIQRVEYADALRHLREAQKLTDRQRDPRQWTDVQSDIAFILYKQGNFKEAEAVAREDVKERLRWSGSENLETLDSRSNLAAVLVSQGQYAEALKEQREVLAICQRLLGNEHPDTLLCRNNLAVTLAEAGQLAEAEKEDTAVLAARQRLLGPEHPDTITSRHILGVILEREHRYAEAQKEQNAVLAFQQRALGAEHPDTLKTRSDLAALLSDLGQSAEAQKEYQAVLAIQERVVGPEHPDTLTTRANLASVLAAQGNYPEAEKEDRRVLALRQRLLGPEHPDTLASRNNLACVLSAQGNYAEAKRVPGGAGHPSAHPRPRAPRHASEQEPTSGRANQPGSKCGGPKRISGGTGHPGAHPRPGERRHAQHAAMPCGRTHFSGEIPRD